MFEFVDIETTSYCNARCPFCNRTNMMDRFKPKHLELDIIKKLPFEKIENVKLIGNKGDCIFYPHLFELIEYLWNFENTTIHIHTNASAHNTDWWRELSRLLKDDKGILIYALDGLEDTHSLHRVGTNFHKIIENVKAFNEEGGFSTCQFLKFKNNEHQVNEVKKLVTSIGTKKFWNRTSRAFSETLERPEGAKTRHEINEEKCEEEIKCRWGFFDEGASFYLTVDGEIRPCCFMADDDYRVNFITHLNEDKAHPQHIFSYLKDPKSINLHFHNFSEIMNAPYYRNLKKNYRYLFRCNQKCHTTFADIIEGEFL